MLGSEERGKITLISREIILQEFQWRNDRGADGASCPRAQQLRGRKMYSLNIL